MTGLNVERLALEGAERLASVRLSRAIRIVVDAEAYSLEYTAEAKRLADDVVATYARLTEADRERDLGSLADALRDAYGSRFPKARRGDWESDATYFLSLLDR